MVCDCGTPWTFLLTFVKTISIFRDNLISCTNRRPDYSEKILICDYRCVAV